MTDQRPASDLKAKKFRVVRAQWPRDKELLYVVRHQVFVVEQQVPQALEWVGDDEQFSALLAIDSDQQPIGTGRISFDGVIGRMAVLKEWRCNGVGAAILHQLIALGAAQGFQQITLSAQMTAFAFYQRHGFTGEGPIYIDAGMEHRKMRIDVAK